MKLTVKADLLLRAWPRSHGQEQGELQTPMLWRFAAFTIN